MVLVLMVTRCPPVGLIEEAQSLVDVRRLGGQIGRIRLFCPSTVSLARSSLRRHRGTRTR